MEVSTMGKVMVTAVIENTGDRELAHRGIIPTDEVRHIEIYIVGRT